MSLQPFTLFSFNISACGFVLVGPKNNNNDNNNTNIIADRWLHGLIIAPTIV